MLRYLVTGDVLHPSRHIVTPCRLLRVISEHRVGTREQSTTRSGVVVVAGYLKLTPEECQLELVETLISEFPHALDGPLDEEMNL